MLADAKLARFLLTLPQCLLHVLADLGASLMCCSSFGDSHDDLRTLNNELHANAQWQLSAWCRKIGVHEASTMTISKVIVMLTTI